MGLALAPFFNVAMANCGSEGFLFGTKLFFKF